MPLLPGLKLVLEQKKDSKSEGGQGMKISPGIALLRLAPGGFLLDTLPSFSYIHLIAGHILVPCMDCL
jgi:hypothetical protein